MRKTFLSKNPPYKNMKEQELEKILREGALQLGVELEDKATENFFTYLRELIAWNKRMNLTSITSEKDIIIRHFLDSLTPYRFLKGNGCRKLLDIGSGAGFPGIPLKIADTGLEVLLLDSVEKKVHFMRHMIRTLGLGAGIQAEKARADDQAFIQRHSSYFDCVISRAFSGLRKFLDLASPYCRKGGMVMAMKGPGVFEEIRDVAGVEPPEAHEVKLPFSDRTTVILMFRKTGENFPQ